MQRRLGANGLWLQLWQDQARYWFQLSCLNEMWGEVVNKVVSNVSAWWCTKISYIIFKNGPISQFRVFRLVKFKIKFTVLCSRRFASQFSFTVSKFKIWIFFENYLKRETKLAGFDGNKTKAKYCGTEGWTMNKDGVKIKVEMAKQKREISRRSQMQTKSEMWK